MIGKIKCKYFSFGDESPPAAWVQVVICCATLPSVYQVVRVLIRKQILSSPAIAHRQPREDWSKHVFLFFAIFSPTFGKNTSLFKFSSFKVKCLVCISMRHANTKHVKICIRALKSLHFVALIFLL